MASPRKSSSGSGGWRAISAALPATIYVVRALSTLAYTGYRARILQGGTADRLADPGRRPHRPRQDAGILGWRHGPNPVHAHELPELRGRRQPRRLRDIWTSVPDALASMANYLRKNGWKPGLPWGFEVALPADFDFRHVRQDFAKWAALGVRRLDGKADAPFGRSVALFPRRRARTGVSGHRQLRRDQELQLVGCLCAGRGHLGDRLSGGGLSSGSGQKTSRCSTRMQREELQKRLAGSGLYTGDPDGSLAPRPATRCGTSRSNGV